MKERKTKECQLHWRVGFRRAFQVQVHVDLRTLPVSWYVHHCQQALSERVKAREIPEIRRIMRCLAKGLRLQRAMARRPILSSLLSASSSDSFRTKLKSLPR